MKKSIDSSNKWVKLFKELEDSDEKIIPATNERKNKLKSHIIKKEPEKKNRIQRMIIESIVRKPWF